jgi:hypothetical protein
MPYVAETQRVHEIESTIGFWMDVPSMFLIIRKYPVDNSVSARNVWTPSDET